MGGRYVQEHILSGHSQIFQKLKVFEKIFLSKNLPDDISYQTKNTFDSSWSEFNTKYFNIILIYIQIVQNLYYQASKNVLRCIGSNSEIAVSS